MLKAIRPGWKLVVLISVQSICCSVSELAGLMREKGFFIFFGKYVVFFMKG